MTDAELSHFWPDLGLVVVELRQNGHAKVADELVRAVQGAATSGEMLCDLGVVLHEHRALRATLTENAAMGWDLVRRDVNRAYPTAGLERWLSKVFRRESR